LHNKIYWKRPFDETLTVKLYPVINAGFKQLPPPTQSPQNAWADIRSRKQISRGCRLGAYTWTPTRELSISSRTFTGLIAGTLTERDFRALFYRTMPPDGGPIVRSFQQVLQCGSIISSVRVNRLADEDDDLITFATRPGIGVQRSATARACEIPISTIVRYLAGLDYNMRAGRPNHSTLASISLGDQTVLRGILNEGQMLVAAELIHDSQMLRLSFGEPDVAVSDYT
jgi:hypothetical protein